MSTETLLNHSENFAVSEEDVNYGPLWTGLSFGFFALTHLFLKLKTPASALNTPSQTWKWRNTANSLIHSTLTGIWALLSFYWHPEMTKDLIGTYSTSSHLLVSVSVGYFMYDFMDMALYHHKRSSYELMIHHFCVILCFGLAELTRLYVGYAVVALLVEVNSVFLHTRQLFIIQGFSRQHSVYRLNSLVNVGTFLIFRILTLGWMTRWLVVHRDQVPFFAYTTGSIALAIIVLMNIILFFRILQVDFINKKGCNKKE